MGSMIHVRVPEELRKDLEKALDDSGVSQSSFIREAIRSYLDIREFRRLRKKVLPFAEARGLLTDDDVFNSIS